MVARTNQAIYAIWAVILGAVVLALVLALLYAWPYPGLWVLAGMGMVIAGAYRLRVPSVYFSRAWGWVFLGVGSGLVVASAGWLAGLYDLPQAIATGLSPLGDAAGRPDFMIVLGVLLALIVGLHLGLASFYSRKGKRILALSFLICALGQLFSWGAVLYGRSLGGFAKDTYIWLGLGLILLAIILAAYNLYKTLTTPASKHASADPTGRN